MSGGGGALPPSPALYHAAMGRGDLAKVRWKNDRTKKKKARIRRRAQAAAQEQQQAGSR